MKRIIKGLLGTLVIFGVMHAGETARNKTNITMRDQYNKVASHTTFHQLLNKKEKDFLGCYTQSTGFYGQTTNGSELGKAFGYNGTNQVTVSSSGNAINERFIHYYGGASPLVGTIIFDPKEIVYGENIDYVHRFDNLVGGLYAGIHLPLLYVAHDLNMKIEGETVHFLDGDNITENFTIQDFFAGKYLIRDSDADTQQALTAAKINGRHSKTGLGDIELYLGYRFWDTKNSHFATNLGVVLPTSKKPSGEFLWEGRTGNCKLGIRGGLEGSTKLWEAKDQELVLHLNGDFTYLFGGSEKRTLGLTFTGANLSGKVLGHYYLAGQDGIAGMFPAANILTRDVDVDMGGKIDAIASFEYTNGRFTLDVGYNFFWKDDETVKVKSWTEDTYGIVDLTYRAFVSGSSVPFTFTDKSENEEDLSSSKLDTSAAETPSVCSHTLFVSTGFIFSNWKYPVMIGSGFSYEVPTKKRTAAEGYKMWTKLGIMF